MIPNYRRGRINNKSIICTNPDCSLYEKVIGRTWGSCCPKCRQPGDHLYSLERDKDLHVCKCLMCWRRYRSRRRYR